jgi:hypothetical protein
MRQQRGPASGGSRHEAFPQQMSAGGNHTELGVGSAHVDAENVAASARVLDGGDEAAGDDGRPGDSGAHDDGPGAAFDGGAGGGGRRNAALGDNGDFDGAPELLNEARVKVGGVRGFVRVAAHGGEHGVGAGAHGGQGFLDGGDVGEHGHAEFALDAGEPVESAETPAARGHVERDHFDSGLGECARVVEIAGDEDAAVGPRLLGDGGDGQIHRAAYGQHIFDAIGADARGTGVAGGSSEARHAPRVAECIAVGRLTGDDEFAVQTAKNFRNGHNYEPAFAANAQSTMASSSTRIPILMRRAGAGPAARHSPSRAPMTFTTTKPTARLSGQPMEGPNRPSSGVAAP